MMILKEAVKRLPVVPSLYRQFRDWRHARKHPETIFTDIYRNNAWEGTLSRSGPGSDIHQTKVVIQALQSVIQKYGVSTMLDIPCGDFHWMKHVDLTGVDYIGADIVKDLVARNNAVAGAGSVQFRHLNLITDPLPSADLVLCRDCLVHLSFEDGLKAIRNICRSGSRYLLTTTFVGRGSNEDILSGRWHPINLEREPYCFPRPVEIFKEQCTDLDGAYTDKSLGLWRIADIPG
jgi:SAM-dependent methyltransferase